MIRRGLQAARGLAIASCGFQGHFSKWKPCHWQSSVQNVRPLSTMSLWPFNIRPRDYSLPNASWSLEMRDVYDRYSALCEEEGEDEEGKKKKGPWKKLPSYNRSLKYATGGVHLSKMIQSKARLFTRSIKEHGAGFEYACFYNKQENRLVCVFQAGHLLEGAPGYVHGGAIATMIDTVMGTLAGCLSGPVMTAYLNMNYRSPIRLGSVVLLHSELDRMENRKIFVTCRVTSTDESKLHTDATALFVSINLGHLFGT